MLKSFFTTRLTTPIRSGQEVKQIKINFLLPILVSTFIYLIFSLVVSIISKEYGLMIAFISSVVLLLLSMDFLRNGSLNLAVVLSLVQGFGLLTSFIMFDGIEPIPQVLMVIFYLIIAGMVTNPKVFIMLVIYAAALIYLMVSGAVVPLFPAQNLPAWFSFNASLVLMIVLIVYAIFLTYRAMMQSIQIAEEANQFLDQTDEEKYKYFSMVEQSPLSVFTTDLDGKIEYVNPRFNELMGYESEEILGENPRIFKTEYTPPDFHEDLWNKISEDRTWIGEFINHKKDESTLYQSAIIKPLFDSSGVKTGYVAFEDDISLQKEIAQEMKTMDQELKDKTGEISQLKEQIKQQSIHDQLTGLYNRAYLNEVLPREILRSTRARNHLILIMIDIDNFRSINDQFGYSTGDLVLKRLAECVNGLAGTYDQIIRSGSDEFMFLYSGKTTELGESRSEQIRDAIEKLSIQTDQGEIKIKISIGIAVFPLHGKKESELLTKAEHALSISKQSGGNRVTL